MPFELVGYLLGSQLFHFLLSALFILITLLDSRSFHNSHLLMVTHRRLRSRVECQFALRDEAVVLWRGLGRDLLRRIRCHFVLLQDLLMVVLVDHLHFFNTILVQLLR